MAIPNKVIGVPFTVNALRLTLAGWLGLVLVLAACSDKAPSESKPDKGAAPAPGLPSKTPSPGIQPKVGKSTVTTLSGNVIQRYHDPDEVTDGREVFVEHCARCHGHNAQGAPNWRQKDADGHFYPPPLNGTGHAWHHSRLDLKHRIRFGSQPGQGKMPGWKDKLSKAQIDAVITYIQSLWPDPIFGAWYDSHGHSP